MSLKTQEDIRFIPTKREPDTVEQKPTLQRQRRVGVMLARAVALAAGASFAIAAHLR